jgi:hypothetical protein
MTCAVLEVRVQGVTISCLWRATSQETASSELSTCWFVVGMIMVTTMVMMMMVMMMMMMAVMLIMIMTMILIMPIKACSSPS